MHTNDKYLLLSLLLLPPAIYTAYQARHQPAPRPVSSADNYFTAAQSSVALGAANLSSAKQPVTLVEFADYQCPPCKLLAARLSAMPLLNAKRGVFLFRNLPLSSLHPCAYHAACLAEAARRQDKFQPMHDLLYLNDGRCDADAEKQYAQTLGLDLARLRRDAQEAGQRQVKRDLADAQTLRLNSTPTLLLCRPGKAPERVSPGDLEVKLMSNL